MVVNSLGLRQYGVKSIARVVVDTDSESYIRHRGDRFVCRRPANIRNFVSHTDKKPSKNWFPFDIYEIVPVQVFLLSEYRGGFRSVQSHNNLTPAVWSIENRHVT